MIDKMVPSIAKRIYGDLATLDCTPQGLKLVDMVEGLDHAALEQLIGLPINRSTP